MREIERGEQRSEFVREAETERSQELRHCQNTDQQNMDAESTGGANQTKHQFNKWPSISSRFTLINNTTGTIWERLSIVQVVQGPTDKDDMVLTVRFVVDHVRSTCLKCWRLVCYFSKVFILTPTISTNNHALSQSRVNTTLSVLWMQSAAWAKSLILVSIEKLNFTRLYIGWSFSTFSDLTSFRWNWSFLTIWNVSRFEEISQPHYRACYVQHMCV